VTRYIGLDVHMQSSTLAVVGPSGKRLQSQVVETNGRALLQVVRAIPTPRYLCLEEGTQSSWLYELLRGEVDDLVVTVPEKRRGVKSDSADAWALAEQLRIGAVKRRVFKNQGRFGALRAAVRGYEVLTRDTVRAKNRLRALFRSRGLYELRDEVWSAQDRDQWMKRLPASLRDLAETLGREVDALEPLKASTEKLMLREAQKHAATKRLATVPGIGPIRAAQIVATVVTPARFRTKRQFWSYCGLAVVTRSSSDWQPLPNGQWARVQSTQTRGLNHNRNGMLKRAFKGAAHQVVVHMPAHPLSRDYQQMVARGLSPAVAKVAVARRIASALLSIWKHEEDYDPAKHRSQNASMPAATS
jgi:transposase